ncbi:MAG TPA: glycosyltransferase family 4 protein [Actinomycetales bacterium]|nr:glycosyltransferase family 4 protein [Actinomycetales bacterium]
MRRVHVLLPEGIDDVDRRSGGNVYDRRVCDALRGLGWDVREHEVPGAWPRPTPHLRGQLASELVERRDGDLVVVDGLLTDGGVDLLLAHARRLRLVVLVHLPEGVARGAPEGSEAALLSAAAAVVATSAWARGWLVETYGLEERRVHIAEPGVDEADAARGTTTGTELLCVAAVTPHKGQDVLLAALGELRELPWHCLCVGSTSRDPTFSAALVREAKALGLADRFVLAGNRCGTDLAAAYAGADVLLLPSRVETYGLVVTEALARGLPVVASDVGGVPEALGTGARDVRPGLLVPPSDVDGLTEALRCWLVDAGLRERLRASAAERRLTLRRWTATGEAFSRVLETLEDAA